MKRYVALAEEIADIIEKGTLRPGDRLPSVREASRAHRVSASTVFQAYYLLEARGLIVTRARSGYFVAQTIPRKPPTVDGASKPLEVSVEVDVSRHIDAILAASTQPDVVPFGSAFPNASLFPWSALGRTMASSVKRMEPRKTVEGLLGGNLELRRQIALRYGARDMRVDPSDIVIANGAMEALHLCLQAVARPGDAVVIESPSFYGALQALEMHGMRAIEAPTDPRTGIDLDALEHILKRQKPAACWLMTTFQNPLGGTMPDAKKRELVALLTHYRTPLIEDDVYTELYFDERPPKPAKAFDSDGWVLHCSSFSKCLAPGYRIGWATAGRFAKDVARLKLRSSISASVPAEVTLAAYLAKGGYDRHLRHLRTFFVEQRDAMLLAIGRYFPPSTRATRPGGGYFLWVECDAHVDALALHAQALKARISLAPGPIFSSRSEFRHCFRLNYGHRWTADVEQAMQTLGRLLSSQRAPREVQRAPKAKIARI
jgi:DNA-binding transcriptional MocR family regulator